MKKIFISQPMRDKTEEEIKKERELLIDSCKREYGEDIEIADTYFDDFNGGALEFLAKSLGVLASCDIAVFAIGWENFCGCKIERLCCQEYGIEIVDVEREDY